MSEKQIEVGQNLKNPIISVKHADLERIGPNEVYKSWCPVCNQGVLLVSRKLGSMHISRYEHCTMCGQQFFYTDDNVRGEPFEEQGKAIYTKNS